MAIALLFFFCGCIGVSFGHAYRLCRNCASFIFVVFRALPIGCSLIAIGVLSLEFPRPSATYWFVVLFSTSLVFWYKISELATKGVLQIPDGKPFNKDEILDAFPTRVLGTHPAGLSWLESINGISPNKFFAGMGPWGPLRPDFPDPAPPPETEWQTEHNGGSVHKRIARSTFVGDLLRHYRTRFIWAIMSPVIAAASLWLILEWLVNPSVLLQGLVAGGVGVLISIRRLKWFYNRGGFISRLFLDAPGNPRASTISAIVETVSVLALFVLSHYLIISQLPHILDFFNANKRNIGTASKIAGAYLGVCSFLLAIRLMLDSIRPISNLTMVPAHHPISQPHLGESPPLTIAHLSDFHLTASDGDKLVDGEGVSPNPVWRSAARELKNRANSLDLIVITGDQTNAGQSNEWACFMQSIQSLDPNLRKKIIILPGNHDLNLPRATGLLAADEGIRVLARVRILRNLAAIDQIQGDRSWVLGMGPDRTKDKIVRLRDYLAPLYPEFHHFIYSPPYRTERFQTRHVPLAGIHASWVDDTLTETWDRLWRPEQIWQSLFPLVIEDPKTKLLIFVLDSNDPGGNIVDNAFGKVRWDQLVQLRRLQAHFGRRPVIYVLHHHVTLPSTPVWHVLKHPKQAIMRRFMVMKNASELIAALPDDRNTIVLHGHRHTNFVGTLKNKVFVSAPSTTLGDEHPTPRITSAPGFSLFTVAATADCGTNITKEEWVNLSL
ncbi:MAG: metallophosphoesterase [Verrucomicrobia bacterium]|nr:metallophosphoesterase [Verrucomicrobiota bacterium]